VSLYKVSKLLGHASISETHRYAKFAEGQLDEAMDVINTLEAKGSGRMKVIDGGKK
jgi:site-specific recombinase XerD